MGNFDEERRKMRFGQVERMLNSDIACAEWCRLNEAPESTMYRRLRIFRDANGACGKQNGWIELDRKEIKKAKALAVTNASAPASSDVAPNAACKDPDASRSRARPIRLRANGVEVDVSANTAPADIGSALEAAAPL